MLKSGEKYFELNIKTDKVSIDWQKRAYLEEEVSNSVCYDEKKQEIPSEILTGGSTEPLISRRRGRPMNAEREACAEERRAKEVHEDPEL